MVGAPASGKSTWTKNFIKRNPDYVVISTDDIIDKYAERDGTDYSIAWSKYIGKASAEARQQFSSAIAASANIIYDQTNMGGKKRKTILDEVENYEKIAVVFDVATKELLRRNAEREKATGKKIPEDVIINMLKNYTPVSKSEGFDKIMRI